jgi:hypothetical protein
VTKNVTTPRTVDLGDSYRHDWEKIGESLWECRDCGAEFGGYAPPSWGCPVEEEEPKPLPPEPKGPGTDRTASNTWKASYPAQYPLTNEHEGDKPDPRRNDL